MQCHITDNINITRLRLLNKTLWNKLNDRSTILVICFSYKTKKNVDNVNVIQLFHVLCWIMQYYTRRIDLAPIQRLQMTVGLVRSVKKFVDAVASRNYIDTIRFTISYILPLLSTQLPKIWYCTIFWPLCLFVCMTDL